MLLPRLALSISLSLLGITMASAEASSKAEQLIKTFKLQESDQPSSQHPRWKKPDSITVVIPPQFGPIAKPLVGSLKAVAGDIPLNTYIPNPKQAAPAFLQKSEVVFAFCSKDLLNQLPQLTWMQIYSSGSEGCTATAGLNKTDFLLTNTRKMAAPAIAEHAIALTMALSRSLAVYQRQQLEGQWQRQAQSLSDNEVGGKTMLILGLGGIGNEVAKRANALGMRVIATRNSSRSGPDYVDKVGLASDMHQLAKEADYVVNALPLTEQTKGSIDQSFFNAMKKGSRYISVGRGKTTHTDSLMAALKSGHLAGAGLDVTDPEPLPKDHPLWTMDNVIITPHTAGFSMAAIQRGFILYQENLRRYLKGDKLLNPVDINRGY
ncbi:D-2-hydroxyacid dehydrogenase [Oceanicoccus sagamiensis]|uniref:D-isomer specific 2-hydroxyacid dehydrogenase NAD-binding domain-containing protein n=1 Tax=Oceanicoccus sagamiensis TaxID=716816 RepID=A0A1X9NDL4_9GAMM|nr:D-2-hydroxyacid dehydrogenase [Oceanicoccus sagamiensis]ARN74492.1 hypothetical protein BST96_10405 [Oceanicoccus sagamiensis]